MERDKNMIVFVEIYLLIVFISALIVGVLIQNASQRWRRNNAGKSELVTATAELPQSEDWIRRLREQLPEVVSIYQNYNPAKTNVIMGEKTNLLWGKEKIEDTIGNLRFSISPQSFF